MASWLKCQHYKLSSLSTITRNVQRIAHAHALARRYMIASFHVDTKAPRNHSESAAGSNKAACSLQCSVVFSLLCC